VQKTDFFVKKEVGPTAVECAVMLSLIIVVCIAAIATLGSNANGTFSSVGSNITLGTGSDRSSDVCGPPKCPFI
jgi:pilus assembly protein Flp/PilA